MTLPRLYLSTLSLSERITPLSTHTHSQWSHSQTLLSPPASHTHSEKGREWKRRRGGEDVKERKSWIYMEGVRDRERMDW